ncbi:MAG: polysaccharide deacetylase family protein [Bacteroidia bacterium]
MSIKVFLFHRVNPCIDPVWQPIKPAHFDKIITYLAKNYEVAPLESTVLGNYKPHTTKQLCAITFDDGYKDFMDYAMPIITKHKVTTSMYIITDCVNANLPPWSYLFNYLLLKTSAHSLEIDCAEIPEHLKKIVWRNNHQKIKQIKQLSIMLKTLSDEGKENVLRQVQAQIKDVENPKRLMLSWDDIKTLKNEGIEIGSHSGKHPALSKTLCLDTVRYELKRSGEEIQKATGVFPLAISYPFGIYSSEVKQIAKEVGYRMGLTVLPERYSLKEDQFAIPRVELYSEPFYKSRLRINGQLQKIKHLVRRLNNA